MKKAVVITGATSGIGSTCAQLFAQHNYPLHLIGRSEQKLKAVAKNIPQSTIHLADFTNTHEVTEVIQKIQEPLFALLNIAGMYHNKTEHFFDTQFEDWKVQDIDQAIDVGLKTTMLFSTGFAKQLQGGAILNMSGTFAKDETRVLLDFVVKNSIEIFTYQAAKELQHLDIRVNAVRPWFVHTPMVQKFFPDVLSEDLIPVEKVAATIFDVIHDTSKNGSIVEITP